MPLEIGILGFAHGHVNAYCTRWRKEPGLDIKVVAGWDHDSARLAKAAKDHGVEPVANADDLLARKNITAVVIPVETSMHADLVEKAAAAGKAIVLQKPMALTMPQADRIVDAVRRRGVPFSMAWQMRCDPQNLKMKELMTSGALGKVFMIRRRHGLNVPAMGNLANTWTAAPDKNRDIWADDASHAIDFIHWMVGVPETVTSEIMSLDNPKVPMDNGMAIFRYPGGPLAEVYCSFTCCAAENTTEIFGSKGSAIQNYGDNPSCGVPRPKDAPGLKWYLKEKKDWIYSDIPSPAAHGERIANLAGPISDFLHGKRPPICTAEEGRTSLRMLLACYVSTREGRRVKLDDPAIDKV
ncbi:MAG: Gfo/Idh/MocA family oxidoreductase [Candidatus Sumerlaeota bacterium]|nr:Gfo/Idh/MocA family oxidoreductase [Candidatus Sumerlaeota bacterium]